MSSNNQLIRKSLLLIFLVLFVGLACEISDVLPGDGTPGEGEVILPTAEAGEPIEPPVEPTEPPIEETTPPEVEPTAPPEVEVPPEGGDEGTSDTIIQALFWLLIVVVAILGIALIVSLFTGRRKEPESQVMPSPSETPPAYAETAKEPEQPEPTPEAIPTTVLDDLTPPVAELYDRFVNMLEALGPVTILPTQTRVDFQRRVIFASVQFSAEDMRVQLLLPHRVDDPRMVRIEIFTEDKISHTLIIRSLDEYDVQFSSWLGEAYELGGQV
jgi:hypothetical protein